MKKRYQIFISSTYEDLIEVRRKAVEEILKLGHIPIGMEMFNPDDSEQWNQIQHGIDESDYYIVIVGQRYGSLTTGGISYTQKEYEYAVKKRKPILRFVIGDEANLKVSQIEQDSVKAKKLEKFKLQLKKKPVAFWNTPDDFALKLVQGLVFIFQKSPQTGWVRGDCFVDPEILHKSGLEEYEALNLNFIKNSIDNRIYYDFFFRNIQVEIEENGMQITITNEFVVKNINDISRIYSPQPCFESEEQAKSYRHIDFQINGKSVPHLIQCHINKKSSYFQFPFAVENEIDYTNYKQRKEVHILHRYTYRRSDFRFFMGQQLQYPCREFRADAAIGNNINNRFKLQCFVASQYQNKADNNWKSEIYTEKDRCQINFRRWSLPGTGYCINMVEN